MKPASRQKTENSAIGRIRVRVRGAVQGVGFRPFVFRLASDLGLNGWVNNSPQGVTIEVEGAPSQLNRFIFRLADDTPPRAFIQSLESSHLEPAGYASFEIRQSEVSGTKTAVVLPDIAVCSDCVAEMTDPLDRRYGYPFTNCTNCGPRYSIIEALPYDRANTSMRRFEMCADCRAEYDDPLDRRFHAQPNACPVCGPHIELWDAVGMVLSSRDEALMAAVEAIREGKIVAVKGLGGFHLVADARNASAIDELRRRKHREEKPLALMFPNLELIEAECSVDELENRLLLSPEAPIVLLRKRDEIDTAVAAQVAPGNPYLGVMLPYTPLHHLLLRELGFPIVATSGNISDEPICIDEREALDRLEGIAELFLVHDRPIVRQVDDSIVRVMMSREMIIRRSRGFAPLPVHIKLDSGPALAVGAHLKNAVAIASGKDVFISQHIGDLETAQAFCSFRDVIESLENLYETEPQMVVCDQHPDYLSTNWARDLEIPCLSVQHHYAHVLSCMAENEVERPALGIAWDGTGYGTDGTIWGGEFLRIGKEGFERIAHFRPFRLPGGEKAAREPRRSALGLLFEIFGEKLFGMRELFPVLAFMPSELKNISRMFSVGLNSPKTSSVGRLFDAVASIVGLSERIRFEGQAAMQLEFLADAEVIETYPLEMSVGTPSVIDWEPMIREIIKDDQKGTTASSIAAKFHNTLVESIVRVAVIAGESSVVLSGGCFQNKYLTERAIKRLRQNGFKVHWHQRVPTNDGGIALGQIAAGAYTRRKEKEAEPEPQAIGEY